MFVFVASDGLIDEVTPLVAAAHLANGLFKNEKNDDNNVLESCQLLIRIASESWFDKYEFYRDDISIIASVI